MPISKKKKKDRKPTPSKGKWKIRITLIDETLPQEVLEYDNERDRDKDYDVIRIRGDVKRIKKIDPK